MTNMNGIGIEFKLFMNGEAISFKLGLIKVNYKRYHVPNCYKLVFFEEDTNFYYSSTLYSGGKTGFGINLYDYEAIHNRVDEDFEIITRDPFEAISLYDTLMEKANEEYMTKRNNETRRIKEEVYDVLIKEFSNYKFFVDSEEAKTGFFVKFGLDYNNVSKRLDYFVVFGYDAHGNEKVFGDVDDYFTKSGNARVSKIADKAKICNIYPEKEFVKTMKKAKKIAEKMMFHFNNRYNALLNEVKSTF